MITSGITLLNTQVTSLTPGKWQAGRFVDHRQPHPCNLLFLKWQSTNGSGRTDLATSVTAGLTTCPIGMDHGSPQTLQSLLERFGLQHIIGANLEALATTDAHLQKLFLGNA